MNLTSFLGALLIQFFRKFVSFFSSHHKCHWFVSWKLSDGKQHIFTAPTTTTTNEEKKNTQLISLFALILKSNLLSLWYVINTFYYTFVTVWWRLPHLPFILMICMGSFRSASYSFSHASHLWMRPNSFSCVLFSIVRKVFHLRYFRQFAIYSTEPHSPFLVVFLCFRSKQKNNIASSTFATQWWRLSFWLYLWLNYKAFSAFFIILFNYEFRQKFSHVPLPLSLSQWMYIFIFVCVCEWTEAESNWRAAFFCTYSHQVYYFKWVPLSALHFMAQHKCLNFCFS